jgi:hypothetical protein
MCCAEKRKANSLTLKDLISWTKMEKFLDFYSKTKKKTNSVRNKAKHLSLFVDYIHDHNHIQACVTISRFF